MFRAAITSFALLGLTMGAVTARAEPDQAAASEPSQDKIASLVVYGNDPCPRSSGDEIVVCGREPESERSRVPKRFRGKKTEPAQESWSNTVRELEWVSRVGTPNSCSPVGSGGATGCYRLFLEQARAERRQARQDAADVP